MTKNIAHDFEEKGEAYVFYLEFFQKLVFAFCIIFRYFLVFMQHYHRSSGLVCIISGGIGVIALLS
jgi:hypothetical protein